MKKKDFFYFKSLMIVGVVMFSFVLISACGTGFFFTPFEGLDDAVLDDDGSNPIPGEIIPGDDEGTLVPGDGGDDGWTPPDAGGQDDDDGDGYPNDQDHFPNNIIYMCVEYQGVSSAELLLNSVVIFGTNFFDNTSGVACRVVNPDTTNTVSSGGSIQGSPGDLIVMRIVEWDPDLGQFTTVFYQTEIIRLTGTPEEFSAQFEINID